MATVASAFSLGMVAQGADVEIRPLSAGDFRAAFEVPVGGTQEGENETFHPTYVVRVGRAVVGHPATAETLTKLLGVPILVSRDSITLVPGDVLMVAQVVGRQAVSGAEVQVPELSFFSVRVYAARTIASLHNEVAEGNEINAELRSGAEATTSALRAITGPAGPHHIHQPRIGADGYPARYQDRDGVLECVCGCALDWLTHEPVHQAQ